MIASPESSWPCAWCAGIDASAGPLPQSRNCLVRSGRHQRSQQQLLPHGRLAGCTSTSTLGLLRPAAGLVLGACLYAKSGKFRRKRQDPFSEQPDRSVQAFLDPDDSEANKQLKEHGEDDEDSWAFWNEQSKPTPGAGGKSRDKVAEPYPDPLPLLTPPPDDEELEEEDQRRFGDQGEKDEFLFSKAYGMEEPRITDVDNRRCEVPHMTTFEEAADELNLQPFLRVALAQRRFFRLTPVQKCSLPLFASNRDFMACAFTGSGKTAAYLVPMLSSIERLIQIKPGMLVASHYKVRDGGKSREPMIGRIRGQKHGLAAIEFELATGLVKRQLILPEWVVGTPDRGQAPRWEGPAQPLAVVLVPTRELSEQVRADVLEFTRYSHIRSVSLFGSGNFRSQLRNLAHGADVLVSTPGRLVDALHKGVLRLDGVKHLVLDEVDRMMELGFGSQLQEIMEQGNMSTREQDGRHTSFFSATLPNVVRELVENFLGRPCIWVDCTGGQNKPLPSTIEHVVVDARPPHRVLRQLRPGNEVITQKGRKGIAEFPVGKKWRVMYTDGALEEHKMEKKGVLHLAKMRTNAIKEDRMEQLAELLKSKKFQRTGIIVFCRRRDTVTDVYKYLKDRFLGVTVCHGGMTQQARSYAVQAVRDGKAEVLIGTDVAARGLDLSNISIVVNFELPLVMDEFVHRCGRTGRIGRSGTVVTFVNGREKIFTRVRKLIRDQGQRFPEWMSHKGMNLPWRPRWYKLPYAKVKETPERMASWSEREAYTEKLRLHQWREQSRMIQRCEYRVDQDNRKPTAATNEEESDQSPDDFDEEDLAEEDGEDVLEEEASREELSFV